MTLVCSYIKIYKKVKFIFFTFVLYSLFWESKRESDYKWGKGRERGREGEGQEEKERESQAATVLSVQSPTRGLISKLWGRDLSCN